MMPRSVFASRGPGARRYPLIALSKDLSSNTKLETDFATFIVHVASSLARTFASPGQPGLENSHATTLQHP